MKPMSEAPRDGTWIIAWCQCEEDGERPAVIRFLGGQWWEGNGIGDVGEPVGWIPCPKTVQEFEAMGRALQEHQRELQAIWDRLPVLNEPLKQEVRDE